MQSDVACEGHVKAQAERVATRHRHRSGVLAFAATLLGTGCGALPPKSAEVVPARSTLACHPIRGAPGTEDIAVHQATGMAYLSSHDRLATLAQRSPAAADGHVGHIFRLDLTQAAPALIDVTPPELRDHVFQPHGISLWAPDGGPARLFVIDHRRPLGPDMGSGGESHAVEVLEVAQDDGRLRRVRPQPITGALLTSPNDLASVGPDSFYVTNNEGVGSTAERSLRNIVGLNQGSLVYFDGQVLRPALSLPLANGVVADVRRQLLYVVSSGDGMLRTLSWRGGHAEALRAAAPELATGARADNLSLEPATDSEVEAILVAAHPSLWKLLMHRYRGSASPSRVLRVVRGGDGLPQQRAQELFDSDGDESRTIGISAASVAAAWHPPSGGARRFVIGSVLTDRVLLCDERP